LLQHFQSSPSVNYSAPKGTILKLPCVVRNRQGECLWLRNGLGLGVIPNKYEFKRTPDNGDCSITIHNLARETDEGSWQCQVLSTSLDQPTLQSDIVTVTVLIAPGQPRIKKISEVSTRLERFALRETEIECSIAKGHPPPIILWYLNDENITDKASSVTSKTPPPKSETVNTLSTLQMTFGKEYNNATLKCVALHPLINQTDSVILNLFYPPEVSVSKDRYSIVEDTELTVECKVDANPPATVAWRRVGDNSIVEANPLYGRNYLHFEKVTRDLNGKEYECIAQNDYGTAKPVIVSFDVLYNPRVMQLSSAQSTITGSRIRLHCKFDGNPTPTIQWYHIDPRTGETNDVKKYRDKDDEYLDLVNVTYLHEGQYFCEGTNRINNVVNIVKSGLIDVDIYGLPAFLTRNHVVTGQRGESSELQMVFCSDPAPYKVYWQFGSIKLTVRSLESTISNFNNKNSSFHERFVVGPMMPITPKRNLNFASGCFEASLLIKDTDISDQRDYVLVVENERGMSEGLIKLKVVKPLSATLVVATLLSIIAVILIISIITLLLIKRKRKGKERVSDEEAKEDAQVLSQNVKIGDPQEEKLPVKNNVENNHELVYANLDFPKDTKPPPTRPKPQMRPSHTRPANNSSTGTEYAKLAFPTKADL
ncbi:cell adhesion molecule-like protein, partial [Dinothrombium tinctorium]